MADNYGYELEFPYLLQRKDKLVLRITDNHLQGSRRHFLRLDLYPLINPSHPRRHYGWWDIPLRRVRSEETDLEFDLNESVIRFRGRGGKEIEITPGWHSGFKELGYISFHVSLWPTSMLGLRSTMVSTRTYRRAVVGPNKDVPLRLLYVPVTNRCNLKCIMCPGKNYHDKVDMDVSDEVFSAALDAAPMAAQVITPWFGEPLLNENIYCMIAMLKRRMNPDSEVGFPTNATLLNDRNTARLFDAGLDHLMVSLDGASRETTEAIRVGVDFDSVIQSIGNFVKYRSSFGLKKPRISCHFVLMERNLHEIPQYVNLCADLGVDFVAFAYLLDRESGMFQTFGKEVLYHLFQEAREVAGARSIPLYVPPFQASEVRRCYNMQHAFVSISGDVLPCCAMVALPRTARTFGNVRKQPLVDIWNSREYVHFRQRVLLGDFPEECKGCDYNSGLSW